MSWILRTGTCFYRLERRFELFMGNCLLSLVDTSHFRSSDHRPDVSKKTGKTGSDVSSHDRGGNKNSFTSRTEREILSSSSLKDFSFSELKSATRNFRSENYLGEGGFGYVYKGWIDELTLAAARPGSGMVVAVKKLKPEGFQGHKEWLREINYLSQLDHPNLVKLIGYCSEGDKRLLVYECMPKGSLENHLFRRGAQPLPWSIRLKIATGAARGLSFLHASSLIYRDVKASNILLDGEFNAKLSDFGLAKEGPTGDRSHVSTNVWGTQGYAAPEYVATGRLTVRSDVYSFGVLLLEILSGRQALDTTKSSAEQSLVDWARRCLSDKRRLHIVMDTKLEGKYNSKVAYEIASLALCCVCPEARMRPLMSDVLDILEHLESGKTRSTSSQMKQESSSHQMTGDTHSAPSASPVAAADTRSPLRSPLPSYRCSPPVR